MLRGISLERIGEIVGVGEVERIAIEVIGDQIDETCFVCVLKSDNVCGI